jgi:amino acid adenylation domain-containing protein
MLSQQALYEFLTCAELVRPDGVAVIEPDKGSITYRELNLLSDRVRDRLVHMGVNPGDRVGFCLHKSIDSLATIFGIMKAGAAYVPVDPSAPAARNAYIMGDCEVKVIVTEAALMDGLLEEYAGSAPPIICLEGTGGGTLLRQTLEQMQALDPASVARNASPNPESLAYILYTSGSTGKPKGVMLTHRSAISFVDWCSEVFEPTEQDRFSSHAPFHFDLSILDIYVPIKHRAMLVLINEANGKDPLKLAPLIAEHRITSWYSTPSILSLLAQYGRLDQHDFSALRTVLFAGEVFPVKHLRSVKNLWRGPRYFNLYGPTETNVCTYYEIPEVVPDDRTRPYPIGVPCSHYQDRIKVVNEHGEIVPDGEEGELCATGPGVMEGYWNLPERTRNAFFMDEEGRAWYRTGDIVYKDAEGDYIYVSRRDRMVKKRGYRVELGEIEAGLYRHPAIREAAVIALDDEDAGVRIKAFLSCKGETRPSLIELKRFCAENLPTYMIPDLFSIHDVLPKTSTDKINYQELTRMMA